MCGAILGRGGKNIKDWRAKFANVEFNLDEENRLRWLRLKGHPYDMCEASVEIADIIEGVLQREAERKEGRANQSGNQGTGDMQKVVSMQFFGVMGS